MTQAERFWGKVAVLSADGCWEWTAARDPKGYGRSRFDGSMRLAHRVSWFLAHGEWPGELCVLHRCDNPPCVNPDHLFLGTRTDNNLDMRAKGRGSGPSSVSHCPQGHEMTPGNTFAWTDRRGNTHRQCRTCNRTASRNYQRKIRNQRPPLGGTR